MVEGCGGWSQTQAAAAAAVFVVAVVVATSAVAFSSLPPVQMTPEEAEFMKRREAARQRVAQRTAQNFGFL